MRNAVLFAACVALSGCEGIDDNKLGLLLQGMGTMGAAATSPPPQVIIPPAVDFKCLSDCTARYGYGLCERRCSY